jgi:hypothetical protein
VPPDKPAPENPTRRRALALWLADKTGAAAITVIVAALLTALGILVFGGSDDDGGRPAALSSQWLRERAEIAGKGWRIAQTRKVDLRGIGEPSTVLVLAPPAQSCIDSTTTRSQEIRVYDVRDGRLNRALTFEPKVEGCPPMEFELVRVAPLREYDEAPLILGRFDGGLEGFPDEISFPVVISWNARFQQYTLAPLLVRPPRLAEFIYGNGQPLRGADRLWYQEATKTFEHPLDLGHGLRGYALSGFAFGRSHQAAAGPIVAGVFRLSAGNAGSGSRIIESPVVYQRAIWSLGTTPGGELYAGECSLYGQPVFEGLDLEDALARRLLERADDLISGCADYQSQAFPRS